MKNKILLKLKKFLRNFIYYNRFLKLARAFHYQTLTPKPLIIENSDKCLLLCPHPDDETFGCGGTLLKHAKNFEIICLTDGRLAGQNQTVEETIYIRKKEFEQCMEKLSITSFKLLNIEDKKLIYNYQIFKSVRIDNYDYIFIPNYFDQHIDHKAVTTLLQKSISSQKPKSNLHIVFYEVWATLSYPNYFVDISDVIEKKKGLINIYSSQTQNLNFMDAIISLNRYRGILTDMQYAEFFSVLDLKTFMRLQ